MAHFVNTPGQLADLAWSAGHPVRPRLSRLRRWLTVPLLILLWTAIVGYWVVTDSNRVRRQAEDALSRLIGGRVKVGSATMSIFEGLRLEDVRLSVGNTARDPDAVLFTARTFLVQVDLRRLLRGQIEPTRLVAIDPNVRLTQNLDRGDWNYHRLIPVRGTTIPSSGSLAARRLPEIVLRNARVDYSRLEEGRLSPQGSIAIEAQLTPDDEAGIYRFHVQSRGESDAMGPRVTGQVRLDSGRVDARLHNFKFGQDVKTMLPEQVQRWWEDHQLAGRVDVPQLSYIAGARGGAFTTAKVAVDGVTLTIQPRELQSSEEIWRRRELDRAFALLRGGGADTGGWITRVERSIAPEPITLREVQGTFTFTPDGIELSDVRGLIEDNAVSINGRIAGYTPDAPADLRITSPPGRPLVFRSELPFVNTLPPQARETYDHLRPQGKATLDVRLNRDTPGGRVDVAGEIEVVDGAFIFDRFPYPVSRAVGRIAFGPDPKLGQDKLELIGLRGYGMPGGVNENSPVRIEGLIAPLTVDPSVDIRISGRSISSEPALMRAFPPMTRRALSALDAPGQGLLPRFTGDFVCEVFRPAGPKMPWSTRVDIDIRDGEAALVAFPYHMSGLAGRILVRDDHVQIVDATMKRDGASVVIGGRVDWGREDGQAEDPAARSQSRVRPNLRVTAVNSPIDQNLLNALPQTHRQWLQRLGVQGRIDLDGRVTADAPSDDQDNRTNFDFTVKLRDATLWPNEGTFALNEVTGELRLRPETMSLVRVSGRRGDASVVASGTVSWPRDEPRVQLAIEATNLLLDNGLYGILPPGGREGWDLVRPEGTVDARISIAGAVGEGRNPGYELTILPRKLAVTPTVFPVRFADVTGKVHVTPERVELTGLIARRGESRITLGGGGDLQGAGAWNLTLAADQLVFDKELAAALPPTLAELVQSAEMGGVYDVTFSKLRLIRDSSARPVTQEGSPTTTPSPFDQLDFACRLETRNGSIVAGVPMKQIVGVADFAGSSRRGRLGDLAGRLEFNRLRLGDIPVENLSASLGKTVTDDTIRLTDLRCDIAGGHAAGQVEWAWPQSGAPRYGLSLVLRDADVTRLGIESAAPGFKGRLTASIALEGSWADPRTRRGRGDVLVEGSNLYRIPLLLGLFQITNLSLPITSPFTQATARYGVDGNRVTFESIQMSADQMKMNGSGYLDFAEKLVRMTFVTDSTTWAKVPIVGPLLQGARRELLQIHVRGSLQEPKVTAGSFATITTTIDEVFRGDRE